MSELCCLIEPSDFTEKKQSNSLFQDLSENFSQCLNRIQVRMQSRKKEIFGQFKVGPTNSVPIQIKLSFKQISETRIIFLGQGICEFKNKLLALQSKALIDTFSRYCTHYMSSLKLGKLSCYESGLIYFRIDVDQVSQTIVTNMSNFLFTIIKTIKGTLEGQISRILYFYQQFSIIDASRIKMYFKDSAKQDSRNIEPKPFQEKQIGFLQDQIKALQKLEKKGFLENNVVKNITELSGKTQKQFMIQEIGIKSSLDSLGQKISEGGFAEIYKVSLDYIQDSNAKKRDFIIKKSKSKENMEKIINEIAIMNYLDNKPKNHKGREYIIQYYHDTKMNGFLFLDPMQHFGMDNFFDRFKEVISIYTKIHLLYQLSIALHFLHTNNCVHLDLKPGNILISRSWQIRLTDFGEAKILEKTSRNDVSCRTLPYAAPEFFQKNQGITAAYDIFSFGVIMHQILFDEYPLQYHESKEQNYIEILKKGDLDKYIIISDLHLKKYGHKDIIQPLAELIKQCLKYNPKERPSINGVVQGLGYCFDYLRGFYF